MFAEKTMEASAITGTGSYQLGTPVGAFKTWRSQFADLSPVFYCAENGDGTIWEIGYGTLTYGSPDTISRSVLASSTGGAISWAVADAPVYVFSAPLATWMKHMALGGVAAAVPAWLPDGGIWSSSADGIAVRLKETIKHGAIFAERGRYEGVPGIWVSSPRSYFVDNGAAGLTLTADMIGRVIEFDTAAGARTLTLPAGATAGIGHGFTAWVLGYGSTTNGVVIAPNGSEVIDDAATGASVTIPPRVLTRLSWDGARMRWRTTRDPTTRSISYSKEAIFGLTLSTAGSSATFFVAAGYAADSTGGSVMELTSSIAKTTAAWSVGNAQGALDTGSIANSTWYHVHLIERIDTGVRDILISLSPTSPTMPANYTRARRIGSMRTNGSAQWQAFTQSGDRFYIANVTDLSTGSAFAMTLTAMSIPTGIIVRPFGFASAICAPSSGGSAVRVAPANNSAAFQQVAWADGSAAVYISAAYEGPPSNTSGQTYVAVPMNSSLIQLVTAGWIDRRGQDS